jgi:hypothetical protein
VVQESCIQKEMAGVADQIPARETRRKKSEDEGVTETLLQSL